MIFASAVGGTRRSGPACDKAFGERAGEAGAELLALCFAEDGWLDRREAERDKAGDADDEASSQPPSSSRS